jgi:drug/metabolite transporter (DMT)-like permease
LSAYPGELAALAASFLFAATSSMFTLAGRRVGSVVVNRMRLVFATLLLILVHWALRMPLPFAAGSERWFWFAISGITGFILGDAFLFQAFIWIGPRLSMLMMALAPALAALLAWIFLGEVLSLGQILGITLTLAGITWVVLGRDGRPALDEAGKDQYVRGILFGLGAATGQALGMVTAKPGLVGDFPALSGTVMRLISALLVLWGYTFMRRQARNTFLALSREPSALPFILAGSATGPTIAVTLTLFAVQNAEVGVASTLTSLTPIILIPVAYFVFKERFGWQAILGTLLAIAGVALLFLV